MTEAKHTTEEYWGSTISIAVEPQGNGRWKATATVRPAGADEQDAASPQTPMQAADQPTAEAATVAARALATTAIDRQRVSRGKP